MKRIIGDYTDAVERATRVLDSVGIEQRDLVQCDTICYRVETNERYDIIKNQLAHQAILLDASQVNGREISVFSLNEPLVANRWDSISYIELPRPKPGSDYVEGTEHVQFVTRQSLETFHEKYHHLDFDQKGLTSKLNPLLRLQAEDITLKFHDKHMGAVISLEWREH